MEPHKKQLHISLAYQFPPDNREKLEALAKSINLDAPVRWDLRLYSRDPRVANCQVSVGCVIRVKENVFDILSCTKRRFLCRSDVFCIPTLHKLLMNWS